MQNKRNQFDCVQIKEQFIGNTESSKRVEKIFKLINVIWSIVVICN